MATTKMIAEKDGAVGRLIFNQPDKHNAVSLEMWEAADGILDDFAADDAVRVVVVTGAGRKAFVSGADISKFESERSSMAAVEHYNETTAGVYAKLDAFAKPTIAMIRGHCIGGGVALAVCCDLRICAEGSSFGVPAARLGLGYGYTGIRRLMTIVGPQFTKEIFFTARRFDAHEAKDMGLINRVVADAELEAYVADYAATIAGNAPLTVAAVKRTVSEAVKDPAERDLETCERLVRECFASQDYVEGRRAFMEKRKPLFVGR